MSKDKQPTKIQRRDFLATSTVFGLGAISGLVPRVALGANDPLMIAPKGATISKLAIYPSIGVCRVGNSEEHFLAPEIPGLAPQPDNGYKEGPSKIKKQAQRFRIYAFDHKGRVIREVTDETDSVKWKVKVANTKAAWYEFNNPLDMGTYAPGLAGKLRNNFYVGKEREILEISPDETHIKGKNQNSDGKDQSKYMAGEFWKEPTKVLVNLGHLRTDEDGRLIVVPGDGAGNSAMRQSPIDNFADNDGWYDDWADGYIKADVTLDGGTKMDVEPAWVTSCGPNYAPEIEPFITLFDVVRDVMVNAKKKPLEKKPDLPLSFREEIYPLFKRLGQMQWIAAAANFREGWIELEDFSNPEYIKMLSDPSSDNKDNRKHVFNQFRNPKDYKFYDSADDFADKIQNKIPYMLGSGVNYSFSPAHWFTMPELQYWILTEWSKGNFINDLDKKPKAEVSGKFEDIPLDQQPMALTRAALEPLSGGAFHPGVELTWPLRQQGIFCDDMPYRIKLDKNAEPLWKQTEQLGLLLTPEAAFGDAKRSETLSGESYSYHKLPENSPINAQKPGDLTRWLGLPWHPDAFSCQAVMYSNDFPNATWWPALLPIDVMPEYCYRQLERDDLHDDEKLKFFNDRQLWTRGVTGVGYHVQGSYNDGLERMVALWTHMGIVLRRPRPRNLSERLKGLIPAEVYVETGRGSMDLYTDTQPNQGLPKE